MSQTASQPTPDLSPADVLIATIAEMLAPIFLPAAQGDIVLAKRAALHAIKAYGVRHQADLIAAAQIVAFGLAAVDSASRARGHDVTPALASRLHATAVACNRAADRCAKSLDASHQRTAEPTPKAPPAPAVNEEASCRAWATAMQDVARDEAAKIAGLPPHEREAQMGCIEGLQDAAAELLEKAEAARRVATHPRR